MNTPSKTDGSVNRDELLWDAIRVLHGDGFNKYLRIQSVDTGAQAWVEVGEINPLTMKPSQA
jgi:hypothetical protein